MHQLDSARSTNASGVRVRSDGLGDPWANEHRDVLGNQFLMQDVDGFMGSFAFAKNTGDRLFLEYVPDDYSNRGKSIRRFGIVGLFDRKQSVDAAVSPHNALTTAFYLHLCRSLGSTQPVAPKFFFIAGQVPPWTMIELDIETGKRVAETRIGKNDWKPIWESFGLVSLRNELTRWMHREE